MQRQLNAGSFSKRSRRLTFIFCMLLLALQPLLAQTNSDCPSCNLAGKNFSGQDLTNANFTGANLSGANFTGAKLSGAYLSRANLASANFTNATLTVSSKGPANLSESDLTNAIFTGADLDGAVFEYADISGTNFTRTDIRKAKFGPMLKFNAPPIFRNAKLSCEFPWIWKQLDITGAVKPACANFEREDEVKVLTPVNTAAAPSTEPVRQQVQMKVSSHVAFADTNLHKTLAAATTTVYVATDGNDSSNCGAVNAPCLTLAKGISQCTTKPCNVLTGYGEYNLTSTLGLPDNVNLYGGYFKGSPTTYQSSVFAPPGGLPAISISGASSIQITGFILNGSAPSNNNQPSIVLQVSNSSGVQLTATNINSYKGGTGSNGTNANPGSPGGTGGDGTSSSGGGGGTSPNGNGNGGSGGGPTSNMSMSCDCGTLCFKCYYDLKWSASYGGSGQPGTTNVWAAGGPYAAGVSYMCPYKERPSTAVTGTSGNNAGCGVVSTYSSDTTGSFVSNQWQGSTGGNGGNGGDGGGGGGGGSGGPCGFCNCVCGGEDKYTGTAGGGGGGGGGGAKGGTGGTQGAPSIGVLLISSTLQADLTVKIVGNAGGDGGTGGNGAVGGTGAGGGNAQAAHDVCNDTGGQGGNGGAGGAGGSSAGGSGGNGGPSVCVAFIGSSAVSGSPNYYIGTSGAVGALGSGSNPTVSGACSSPAGVAGIKGMAAITHQY